MYFNVPLFSYTEFYWEIELGYEAFSSVVNCAMKFREMFSLTFIAALIKDAKGWGWNYYVWNNEFLNLFINSFCQRQYNRDLFLQMYYKGKWDNSNVDIRFDRLPLHLTFIMMETLFCWSSSSVQIINMWCYAPFIRFCLGEKLNTSFNKSFTVINTWIPAIGVTE